MTAKRKPLYLHKTRDGIRQQELARPGWEPLNYGLRMADDTRILHSPLFRLLANKTQLFPQSESPLVRNRLTHTLEVADIACRIARRLNRDPDSPFFVDSMEASEHYSVDETYVRASCYAHDMGHPPFGHSGEFTLNNKLLAAKERKREQLSAEIAEINERLKTAGDGETKNDLIKKRSNIQSKIDDNQHFQEGYEGNAQTLRIATFLEKRIPIGDINHGDDECTKNLMINGLNLTIRSIASLLKYDGIIGSDARGRPSKGYYRSEAPLIKAIREKFEETECCSIPPGEFCTLECSIMDLADDIAYSTYDFEDAMIMGLVDPMTPVRLLYSEEYQIIAPRLLSRINSQLEKAGYQQNAFSSDDLEIMIPCIFGDLAGYIRREYDFSHPFGRADFFGRTALEAERTQGSRHNRRYYSEILIGELIDSLVLDYCPDAPALSKVRLTEDALVRMIVRKSITFELVTMSHTLRVFDQKAIRILSDLFDLLVDTNIHEPNIIPIKMRNSFQSAGEMGKERFVADFLASMSEHEVSELHRAVLSGDRVQIRSLNFFG